MAGRKVVISSQTIPYSISWSPNQTNGISRGCTRGTGDPLPGNDSIESS